MNGQTQYLNTDLDLRSSEDLKPLTSALEARGVPPLHVTQAENGLWYSILETAVQFSAPEPNIAAMVEGIESLDRTATSIWDSCTQRDFNIGYDCGLVPMGLLSGALSRPPRPHRASRRRSTVDALS
ncbi:hypothetical protein Pan44_42430 [Caulifigura coniformis]|uniref:Uncharacterized protein n=1 Tax=Caulifigura coniformis TaxID=2527983 RepID=A0A517SJ87_9PLAN|nr:hypothetical protein [Caulifigura coniformis]QDT56191.1 hypothetical protein Pan44_42430 [Caulifigura coniformis]